MAEFAIHKLIYRHSFIRYPVISELAFGNTRGCFELPDKDKEPGTKIDCPDVTPLQHSDRPANREAMLNSSPLIHPDAEGTRKYCLGTGLQMKNSGKSHKLNTCKYHNSNLSVQGKLHKTMTQEVLQVIAGNF